MPSIEPPVPTDTTAPLADGRSRLLLPPPFVAERVGSGDILDEACAKADRGAGTLLWRADQGVLAFAVILEPSPPLVETRAAVDLAYYASLAATCDALAHHAQPERPLRLVWPDQITYDGARLAGARYQAGPLGPDGLPIWVAFAAEVILARDGLEDTGLFPNSTSLEEEEFGEVSAILESFAAYLKLIVDRWTHQGPQSVLRRLLERVEGETALRDAHIKDGHLHLPPLEGALDASLWRDADRGGPSW